MITRDGDAIMMNLWFVYSEVDGGGSEFGLGSRWSMLHEIIGNVRML